MIRSVVDNMVRIGALVCLWGLVTGYRADDVTLKIMEVLMLIIWVQMDYGRIIRIFKRN